MVLWALILASTVLLWFAFAYLTKKVDALHHIVMNSGGATTEPWLPEALVGPGPTVVLVIEERCTSCRAIVDELRRGEPAVGAWVSKFLLVTDSNWIQTRQWFDSRVELLHDQLLFARLAKGVTPQAHLFAPSGRYLGSEVISTIAQLERLSPLTALARRPL